MSSALFPYDFWNKQQHLFEAFEKGELLTLTKTFLFRILNRGCEIGWTGDKKCDLVDEVVYSKSSWKDLCLCVFWCCCFGFGKFSFRWYCKAFVVSDSATAGYLLPPLRLQSFQIGGTVDGLGSLFLQFFFGSDFMAFLWIFGLLSSCWCILGEFFLLSVDGERGEIFFR